MNIDFSKIEFNHCLRIEYTKIILKELIDNKTSINLISGSGNGKTRLLKDLYEIVYPDLIIAYVNLKDYIFNYKGLINYIKDNFAVKGNCESLSKIFTKCDKSKYHILLIDNYDAILQELNMDIEYNEDFFNDLNMIKNMAYVSILCSTKIPHNNMLVYIGGQKTNRNSWLTLERENLPKLIYIQIEIELKRQIFNKDLFNGLNNTLFILIQSILNSKEPYSVLCFIAKQLNTQTNELKDTPIKKRYKHWVSLYKKQKSKSLDKNIYIILDWFYRIYKVLRLDKIGNPILNIITKVIGLLTKSK